MKARLLNPVANTYLLLTLLLFATGLYFQVQLSVLNSFILTPLSLDFAPPLCCDDPGYLVARELNNDGVNSHLVARFGQDPAH